MPKSLIQEHNFLPVEHEFKVAGQPWTLIRTDIAPSIRTVFYFGVDFAMQKPFKVIYLGKEVLYP